MTRPTSGRNFSSFLFFKITQNEWVTNDFFVVSWRKKKTEEEEVGQGEREGWLPSYNLKTIDKY